MNHSPPEPMDGDAVNHHDRPGLCITCRYWYATTGELCEACATQPLRTATGDRDDYPDPDYPDPSDIDICPAGGPHTPVDNFDEADDSGRRISPGWHCGECGASLPSPEREP